MPANLADFADDTAFERYILDRATPLMPREEGTSVIELEDVSSASVAVGAQPTVVRVGLFDAGGSGSAGKHLSTDDLRPLLFGAAWKVIDQLIEFALEAARVPHNQGRHYTIGLKVREAANGNVPVVPPIRSPYGSLVTNYDDLRFCRGSPELPGAPSANCGSFHRCH